MRHMYECKAFVHNKLILSGPMETMGDRIRKKMDEKSLSLRTVAKRMGGISHGAIQNWIGGAKVDDRTLERLARVLGTTVKYLRIGEESPIPQVNYQLLTQIIISVEINAKNLGIVEIPTEKKAEIISALYSLFRGSGIVDDAAVSNILRLTT